MEASGGYTHFCGVVLINAFQDYYNFVVAQQKNFTELYKTLDKNVSFPKQNRKLDFLPPEQWNLKGKETYFIFIFYAKLKSFERKFIFLEISNFWKCKYICIAFNALNACKDS